MLLKFLCGRYARSDAAMLIGICRRNDDAIDKAIWLV